MHGERIIVAQAGAVNREIVYLPENQYNVFMNSASALPSRPHVTRRLLFRIAAIFMMVVVFAFVQGYSLRHVGDGLVDGDEGTWWAAAYQINVTDGLPYVDAVDNKPPAVIWIMQLLLRAAPSVPDAITYLHYLCVLLFLASLPGVYVLTGELLGSRAWGAVATLCYSLDPLLLIMRTEAVQRMLAVDLWGLSLVPLVMAAHRSRRWEPPLLVSALVAGTSVLFQQSGVFMGLLAVGYLAIHNGSKPKRAVGQVLFYLVAFILPAAGLVCWAASNGILTQLYTNVVAVNHADWLTELGGKKNVTRDFFGVRLLLFPSIGFLASVAMGRHRPHPSWPLAILLLVWGAVQFVFNWAAPNYYDHYNVLLVLSVVSLLVLAGTQIWDGVAAVGRRARASWSRKPLWAICIGIAVALFVTGFAITAPDRHRIQMGYPDRTAVEQEHQIDGFVDGITAPSDRIYVFGNPAIYARASRLSPIKYHFWTQAYRDSLIGQEYEDSIVNMLTEREPRVVVLMDSYRVRLPTAIKNAIQDNYVEVKSFEYSYEGNVASIMARRWLPAVDADLLQSFKQKEAVVAVSNDGDPNQYVYPRSFNIDGDTREVLFMHPTSSATFELRLPSRPSLEFAIGVDPEVWSKPGDGVEFEVDVTPSGGPTERLFTKYVNPKAQASDREWIEESVDLGQDGGKTVSLTLRTLPGSSPDYDWAGWANLRVMRR
jgi:hypothetical protein